MPGWPRQRPSRNHLRIVAAVGGSAGPGRSCSRRRSSSITRDGASPAANRPSASARSCFQE